MRVSRDHVAIVMIVIDIVIYKKLIINSNDPANYN